MAPQQQVVPAYQKNEKALCFHGMLLYNCRILDARPTNSQSQDSAGQFEYKIHYDQWKSKWDSWVSPDRLRKLTLENVTEKERLIAQLNPPKSAKSTAKPSMKKKSGPGGDTSSVAESEERTPAPPLTARGQKRARENGIETEEAFMGRRSVRITLPDHLKAILVDDWEFVSKDQKIVPLPSPIPVRAILQDYYQEERARRTPGSAKYDLVQEVRDGLIDYFERCLGKFLLYKIERTQYSSIVKMLLKDEWKDKSIVDVYGAEHLARTLTTLPLDIAESNMDRQSVDVLREELQRFAVWLSRHSDTYFTNAYENAPSEHIEKARNGL